MAKIIELIDARLADLKTNATVVSRAATDSDDTIRNWRRAIGKNANAASATAIKLNQIEAALGVELTATGTGLDPSSDEHILSLLVRIDGLSPENRTVLQSSIRRMIALNKRKPGQPALDDQDVPSSPRHESAPSQRR